jgi:hypothetical protein
MFKLSLLLTTLLILGCNKSESPTTTDSGITYDQIAGGANGKTWSRCYVEDGIEWKDSFGFNLTGGDSLNITSVTYDLDGNGDPTNCDSQYETSQLDVVGTFSITGKKVYVDQTNIYLTPLTVDFANFLVGESYCGFSGWAINVDKEITNLVCVGVPMTPFAGYLDASYHTNYIKIDGDNYYLEE